MSEVNIPEMYYLAVALDLGIQGRSVTREDARLWVEKLMRDRVALLHTQLGEVLARAEPSQEPPAFAFSFGMDEDDFDNDLSLESEDDDGF